MFSKMHAALFALSILSISFGRPFDSEAHVMRVHKSAMVQAQVLRAQVIPVVSASCSSCATRTVTVSGTATASAAFTVTVGPAPTSTTSPNSIGNFGSCTVPQIEFGAGFDGHNETSFRPVDRVSYSHDSADDITVITDFICSSLVTKCGADLAAQATCAKAQEAAAAQTPQQGIDADAFNDVFGFQTNFKDVQAISDTGNIATGSMSPSVTPNISSSAASQTSASTDAATDSTSSTALSNATATASPPVVPALTSLVTVVKTGAKPSVPSPTPAANSGPSNNLQTFTGALGGISAPAVVASGNQFEVVGNPPFNKKTDALSRSCDIQQNYCANAANASRNQGSFTVAACQNQQSNCKAASAA